MDDAYRELPNFHYLSDTKYGAVVAVTMLSSLLSSFGSFTVLYLIVSKRKYVSLFHRIVLCLCMSDIVASISTLLQPFLAPSYTGLPLAIGSTETCEVVGFFFQFVLATHFYSSVLSLYFLVTIRYNWKEDKATRVLEPCIHVLAWALPLTKSSIGVAIDAINPGFSLNVCYFENSPPGCDENPNFECRANTKTLTWVLWFFNIISFLAAIFGVVCTWLVYSTVRTRTRRSQQYVFRGSSASPDREYTKNMKAVAVQAVCYTLAFLNSFLVSLLATLIENTFNNSLEDVYTKQSRPLSDLSLFLLALFFPLQGFFMAIIYMRPTLVRWKRSDPKRSWRWAFRQVLSGRKTPTVDATRQTQVVVPEVPSVVENDNTDDTDLAEP